MSFFCVLRMRHAGISSVFSVTKSSHTLYGAPLFQVTVYGTWGIPSRSMIPDAITSLKGCCRNGLLPPLIRQRLPSMIFHRFFRLPSEVLSGELKSSASFFLFSPNKTSPISSEKSFSKKLILSQVRLEPSGQIQYWSDRLSPQQRTSSILVLLISSVSSASRTPERLAGMERSVHHSLSAARSAAPFLIGMPTGRCSGA